MFLLRMMLIALRSLRANFIRSILAALGIVIGVGTVIAAVGVIEGATRDWLTDMQKVGSNVMWLRPGSTRQGGVTFAGVKPLGMDDVDEILADPTVAAAAPEIQSAAQIKFGSKNEVAMVVGTTPDFFEVFSFDAHRGRLFNRSEHIGNRPVATIGYDLAEKLFEARNPVGEEIRVGKRAFQVVGVMKEKGLVGFSDFDGQIYIPIGQARAMFRPRTLSLISVRGVDQDEQEETRTAIAAVLRRTHR
ncbi:MAG: ABC transporter permease, partial [bacterium]|nr:ABC transporter permease [bacterium]